VVARCTSGGVTVLLRREVEHLASRFGSHGRHPEARISTGSESVLMSSCIAELRPNRNCHTFVQQTHLLVTAEGDKPAEAGRGVSLSPALTAALASSKTE
jgi:hypothetical protein